MDNVNFLSSYLWVWGSASRTETPRLSLSSVLNHLNHIKTYCPVCPRVKYTHTTLQEPSICPRYDSHEREREMHFKWSNTRTSETQGSGSEKVWSDDGWRWISVKYEHLCFTNSRSRNRDHMKCGFGRFSQVPHCKKLCIFFYNVKTLSFYKSVLFFFM